MKYLDFAAGVKLPLQLVMQPIALLGNRSSGKTYGGLKLFEQTHKAGVQSIAIDCVGKWWGSRLGRDGKAAGGLSNVYIFGGKRADFPLLADKGALVAKVLIEKRCSAVLDVSLLRKGDRKRFLTDFAEEFHHLAKQEDVAHPCVLFLEEAHTVIPQKPQKGDERMLGAFEDIVLLGRNAGMGVVIMDQRPAHVNKSCLAMVEVLIALRTTWHADRKVYAEWIGAKSESGLTHFEDDLASLQRGHGFIWAPTEKIFAKLSINERETFDASATAKVGGVSGKVGALNQVDVKVLGEAMSAVVAEAEQSNPRRLQTRVRELESELAKAKSAPAPAPVTVTQPVSIAAELKMLEKTLGALRDIGDQLAQRQQTVVTCVDNALMKLNATNLKVTAPAKTVWPPTKEQAATATAQFVAFAKKAAPRLLQNGDTKIIGKQQDMLNTLAALGPLRREALAVLVVMTPGSGGFNNYVGGLASHGLVVTGGGNVAITDAGRAQAQPDDVHSRSDLIAAWMDKLVGKERDIFHAALELDGTAIRREAMAVRVEMTPGAGGFNNYVGHLSSYGLIETGGGQIVVSPILFKVN